MSLIYGLGRSAEPSGTIASSGAFAIFTREIFLSSTPSLYKMFNQPRLYTSRKIQVPSSKHQGIFNSQAPKQKIAIWNLLFRASLVIGIWCFLTNKHDMVADRSCLRSCGDVLLPLNCASSSGALAQLVRAPPCHGGGCGFEPRRLRICFSCVNRIFLRISAQLHGSCIFFAKVKLVSNLVCAV